MTIVFFPLIAFLITVSAAMLDHNERRYYYFALGIVLAGTSLSLLGYKNKLTMATEYFELSTQVLAFEPLSGVESIGVRTVAGDFYISSSYVSKQEREKILTMEWTPSG